MKMNLKVLLPTVVVMLFMLSLTGYAHGRHDDTSKNGATIALDNLSSPVAKDSLVSRWLEARLAEESLGETGGGEYTFGAAWIYYEFEEGGGWCDNCGCWMRHSCDPNGNCENSHDQACSGPGAYCDWHGNCSSS